LGDARCDIYAYCLENDFTNEKSFGLSVPIFRGETRLEKNIDCSANVFFI
jgi:hypothetical protein